MLHRVQGLFAVAFPLQASATVAAVATAPTVQTSAVLHDYAILAASLATIISGVAAIMARRFPSTSAPRKRRAKPVAKGGEL